MRRVRGPHAAVLLHIRSGCALSAQLAITLLATADALAELPRFVRKILLLHSRFLHLSRCGECDLSRYWTKELLPVSPSPRDPGSYR